MTTKAEQIDAWIDMVLAERGWSSEEWCRRAGIASSNLSAKRRAQYTMSNKTLDKLEKAAGIEFGIPASMEERELVALFRALPPHSRRDMLLQIRAIAPDVGGNHHISVVDRINNEVVYSGRERRRHECSSLSSGDKREPLRYFIIRKSS